MSRAASAVAWTLLTAALVLCLCAPASAAIAFRAAASGFGASSPGSVTIAKPTGTVLNDVMVATIASRDLTVSVTAPTNWILVNSVSQTSGGTNGMKLSTYYKVATGSEPANYTWTFSGGTLEFHAGGINTFSGVDTSSPIAGQAAQAAGDGSNYAFATPSITPTSGGAMLVTSFSNQNADVWTPPAGFTESMDQQSPSSMAETGIALEMAYRLQATAAAVSATATAGGTYAADYGATQILALKPAQTSVLIASYDFEESSWNGTAGEVKDTAGYAGGPFNGRAQGFPVPSAASASPARSGSPGTCRYATLPGASSGGGRFELSGLPVSVSAGAKTSVAFWMYWNGGDSVMPLGWQIHNLWFRSGHFGFNTGASDVFGMASTGLANTWRHVVAVFTNGSVVSNKIYIDGVSQTLTQRLGTPSTASAVVGSSLRLGGWGNSTAFRMTGRVDQVRVYNGALNDAEVTALHAETRNCPAVIDHYELSTPSAAVSCLASTVTVTACADTSSPCTNAVSTISGQTATLAASAGTLGSNTVTFNAAGVATTTLSHAAAANGATVTVTLSGEQTSAASARQCCPNGSSCAVANSCSTTYSTAGFIVAAAAGGAVATVPAQTAGTTSPGYFLRAVQTNTSTKACEAAITGVGNVNWSYQCNNPSTCSASNLMTLTGNAANTIARNNNGSTASSTAVAMTFDANGNAPFSFNYADVGQVTLNASRAASGSLLTTLIGASNAFVVRPGGFALSAIRQTAAPQLVNPVAASAAGAKFVAAGEAFSATVTATTSGGATTPNYGRETSAEGVLLTRALVLPAGGASGTLSNGTIAGGSFTAGVATVTNLAFSEVGIITLSPAVADGDYLGAGNVTGTTTANIGRFFPAQFALSGGSVTHRSALGCSPASSFSYLGENFRLGLTLTAQNTAGATTANYTGAFAKLDPITAGWNLAGRDATTVFTVASTRLSLGSATGSFSNGVASGITLTANAARAATPDGPFTAAFGVAPVDSDGVAMAAFDLASTSGGGNDRTQVASLALRFGRLRVGSAAGAADRALVLPVAAQSWNGSAFDTHTLDSCTAIATTAMSFGNLRGTLTTADTAASGAITLANGLGSLRLAAPGGGRSGTYDVALSLGSSATDASCLQPWTPAVGDAATAGANLAYLRGNFCASTYGNDPAARATFGRPRGVDSLVYRRENF